MNILLVSFVGALIAGIYSHHRSEAKKKEGEGEKEQRMIGVSERRIGVSDMTNGVVTSGVIVKRTPLKLVERVGERAKSEGVKSGYVVVDLDTERGMRTVGEEEEKRMMMTNEEEEEEKSQSVTMI